jgi:hypothetical protein
VQDANHLQQHLELKHPSTTVSKIVPATIKFFKVFDPVGPQKLSTNRCLLTPTLTVHALPMFLHILYSNKTISGYARREDLWPVIYWQEFSTIVNTREQPAAIFQGMNLHLYKKCEQAYLLTRSMQWADTPLSTCVPINLNGIKCWTNRIHK